MNLFGLFFVQFLVYIIGYASFANAMMETKNEQLLDTAFSFDLTRMGQLLEMEADPNYRSPSSQWTPLTIMATQTQHGHESVKGVEMLLAAGADINAPGIMGKTALILASEKGNVAVVEYLLEKGADPDIRDEYDMNAWMNLYWKEDQDSRAGTLLKKAIENAHDLHQNSGMNDNENTSSCCGMDETEKSLEASPSTEDDDDNACCICNESFDLFSRTPVKVGKCGHRICMSCVKNVHTKGQPCPMCRGPLFSRNAEELIEETHSTMSFKVKKKMDPAVFEENLREWCDAKLIRPHYYEIFVRDEKSAAGLVSCFQQMHEFFQSFEQSSTQYHLALNFNHMPSQILSDLPFIPQVRLNLKIRHLPNEEKLANKDNQLLHGLNKHLNLVKLDLSHAFVSDTAAVLLADSLAHHPNLEVLDLSSNCIKTPGFEAIVSSCLRLKKVSFRKNYIGGTDKSSFSSLKRVSPDLEFLDLTSNYISSLDLGAISNALQSTSKLKVLSFSGNYIGQESAENVKAMSHFANAVAKQSHLQVLNLAKNYIRDPTFIKTADALIHCNNLRVLDLSRNYIGDVLSKKMNTMSRLAAALERQPNLEELVVSKNYISEKAMFMLADAVSHAKNLKRLEIGGNCLGSADAEIIRHKLHRCRQLHQFVFHVDDKFLCGYEMAAIRCRVADEVWDQEFDDTFKLSTKCHDCMPKDEIEPPAAKFIAEKEGFEKTFVAPSFVEDERTDQVGCLSGLCSRIGKLMRCRKGCAPVN